MTLTRSTSRAILGAAVVLGSLPRTAAADELRPEFQALLHRYARGERVTAVSALGAWKQADLERQLGILRSLISDAERCPDCAEARELEALPLRAAVLLHWDRNEVERPQPSGVEHPRPCLGPAGLLAGQYAGQLARLPETRDFARRFFLAMVLRMQWDFCLDDAQRWGEQGLARFPRDAALLLALGCVYEESATLGGRLRSSSAARLSGAGIRGPSTPDDPGTDAAEREFREARRLLSEAVAADGAKPIAQVHLGRTLWRLGEHDGALTALESALASARLPHERFLAHLFLGQVHEDARRLDAAIAEYGKALEIDPGAQSASVALSHALRQAGEVGQAREVLARGLALAGRRQRRDAYWDYIVATGFDGQQLLAELRRESLR